MHFCCARTRRGVARPRAACFFVAMPVTIARAPTRLDFGGGWTDVPPYSTEEGGFVCNVAISRHVTVRLTAAGSPARRAAPAKGASEWDSLPGTDEQALAAAVLRRYGAPSLVVSQAKDFPVGAGLGGSSAAGVATIAALATFAPPSAGRGFAVHDASGAIDRSRLAEASRAIEVEELGIPGGRQDHYAAAYGGALALTFGEAGTEVQRIALPAGVVRALESRLVVVYSGESRISGDTITAVLDAYGRRERGVLTALACMKGLAREMATALAGGDIDALGALVGEHWRHQRALHPAIPTARIDAIVERGTAAGALGCKALGASGGGCVLLVATEESAPAVRAAVTPLGRILPFTLDSEGVRAWTEDGKEDVA